MTAAAIRMRELRARRRSERRCINCPAKLRSDDGVRCRPCADRAVRSVTAWQAGNRARRNAAARRQYRARRDRAIGSSIALECRLLAEARRAVRGCRSSEDRARMVAAEYDRLRRRCGLPALVTNEPPPGWSVEADRCEELLALSEHLALRRVS